MDICHICTVKELPASSYIHCHNCDYTTCQYCVDTDASIALQEECQVSDYDRDGYWLCKDCTRDEQIDF